MASEALLSTKERITKDLHRTHLATDNDVMQSSLCKILLAIAYVLPNITYCQGMNCIAATLLSIIKHEETCFVMFFAIIKEWCLEKIFEPGLPDLLLREYQFNFYTKKLMPELYHHFKQEGITTGFFMSRWFLTIFSIYLPLEALEKVWDCIFYSKWKSILKISLALMMELQPRLLNMDKSSISSFIRNSARESTSDNKAVLFLAYDIKVTNKKLEQLKNEFHLEVAYYKLHNDEPYLTEDENRAIAEARLSLADKESENLVEIKEIQASIELNDKRISTFQKEHAELTLQIHELENNIENMCEMKGIYLKNLEDMQEKHYSDLKNLTNKNTSSKFVISKEDLLLAQDKIRSIDDSLKELTKDYINKVIFT